METNPSHGNHGTSYETRDTNNRALAYFGLVLLGTVVISLFFVRGVFVFFSKTQSLGPTPTPFETTEIRTLPPFPRLQVKPVEDLEHYRYEQQQTLQSYGWLSKQAGTVHIPIDRAMSLIVQRGLPARQTPPPREAPIPSGEISTPSLDPAAPVPATAPAPSPQK